MIDFKQMLVCSIVYWLKKGWFYLVFVRASKTDHHHDGMIDTNQIHKKLIYKLYHQLNNLQRAVLFPGHLQD